MIYYGIPGISVPNTLCGTNKVHAHDDGYSIEVCWYQAHTNIPGYKIAYNIYYSVEKGDVFSEGVKYVSIDESLCANIICLTPGQMYFFAIRPVEYDPTIYDLNLLPIAYDNLRVYPISVLRQNIGASDLIIPMMDVCGFPPTGVIEAGVELIQYISVDQVNSNLILQGASSAVSAHFVDQGNDGYYLPNPNNKGLGALNNLSVDGYNAVSEDWIIRCIFVQHNIHGATISSTAKFEAIGAITGVQRDGYSNPIIWVANGINMAGSILSFSIAETDGYCFVPGDQFMLQVVGKGLGISGGRGYNNTPITEHTTSGFDGYNTYNPIIPLFILGESNMFDRIFQCQCRFEYPHYSYTFTDGYKQVTKDILSTDLSAADAANIAAPLYDYSGYHRTDPVLLLNGTCVGSYIGGQQGCIDANGNYNIYRGLSVQDMNTQRQQILLSLTGQPAVLIKRQQTGIVCSCYLPSSEYPDDRCPKCFVPGTLVRTITGYKPIEEVFVGDLVLSSDGQYHEVLKTFGSMYDGYVQSIRSSVSANPILATAEHPFMTMRGSHNMVMPCSPNSGCKAFIERGDGNAYKLDVRQTESGKWQARTTVNGKRTSLGTFDTKEDGARAINECRSKNTKPGHILEWDDAKNIKEKDWLVAKWPTEIKDVDIVEVPQEFRKNTILGEVRLGLDRFVVDEEFLWVIGMYLAEGSCGKRTVNFALHKKETDFRDRIMAFFTRHGYRPTYHIVSENGMVVDIHSTTLAKWFPKWLGRGCWNKHIPEELMSLPGNKSWAIIRGIYDGDGSKRENEIGQTSEILALQMSELLHRIGEQPITRNSVHKTLTPKGNKRRRCYHTNWTEDTLTNNNRKGRWVFGNEILAQVKKSSQQEYHGPVYNLEVAGDHTYVVQGVLVHNCLGTKFVIGWEQYFNPLSSDGRIQVRLTPTAENLKMHEAGLESEFPLDMWTLTVPTIHTRDIIVLFDQDGNESFRYEVSNVIRNNLILGLDGGQHLNTFRIRKFDPAYQIPIFDDTSSFPTTFNTSIGFMAGIPHTHTVVTSEKITSISQLNEITGISQGHSHPIYSGIVGEAVDHTHTIILST